MQCFNAEGMIRGLLSHATFAVALVIAVPGVAATVYDTPAANATTWLLSQQNADDGSWGATDDLKYVRTSEAVLALAALNRRTPAYYAGLTWLQNHAPVNIDHTARRVLATQSNGGSVTSDIQALQSAQGQSAPGTGWGLARTYQSAALDTALALQAYNQAGVSTNVASAVTYLTGAQLTGSDKGWAIGQGTTSDPITTAHVLIALIPLKANYSSLPTAISNGLAALNAKVTTTSPVQQRALAVVANLRNSTTSSQAATLLSSLTSTQNADGSWGDDIYTTALVARSLAAGMARDLTAQQQLVNMPDAALRTAVNHALGRNAMDALNVGELAQLTSLTAAGLGITDLTGLQYATNLTYLDVRNNSISSFTPVAALSAATILEDGNPGYAGGAGKGNSADVPTVPEWGAILLGGLLLLGVARSRNGQARSYKKTLRKDLK